MVNPNIFIISFFLYVLHELQKEATFNDFVGEFFLIWFYPIGIWFVQPEINKVHETSYVVEQ